jgi:hypothetical protein
MDIITNIKYVLRVPVGTITLDDLLAEEERLDNAPDLDDPDFY